MPFSAMSKVPSTPINLPATTNILICTVHEQLVGIGILHRDISIPNLALSCNSEHLPNQQCSADTPRAGILIDFDHATWLKEVDEVPLIPRKHEISNIDTVVCYVILSLWQMLIFLTKALPFIATEILCQAPTEPVKHTFQHDLESFFCVFIWICTTYERPGVKRKPDILGNLPWSNWRTPSDNGYMKRGYLMCFETAILSRFAPYF